MLSSLMLYWEQLCNQSPLLKSRGTLVQFVSLTAGYVKLDGLPAPPLDLTTGIFPYIRLQYSWSASILPTSFKKLWEIIVFAPRNYVPTNFPKGLNWEKVCLVCCFLCWNQLQNNLNFPELLTLDTFQMILNDLEAGTSGCRCCVLLFFF